MKPDLDTHTVQLRKGVVELAVLALLAGSPRYGQQIVDELSDHHALALTAGTVYPLLSRLLKSGQIASRWEESPVGPPRKYYRLTPDGATTLRGMTDAWAHLKTAIDSLLETE